MRCEKDLKNKSPYIYNLSTALLNDFSVVNYGKPTTGGVLNIARYIFKVDMLFFNWIEDISITRIPIFIFFYVIAKLFNKKIVWTHHNVHPHRSNGKDGFFLMKFLIKRADYIIIHTKESYPLLNAEENDKRILYYFHPFFTQKINDQLPYKEKPVDLLIWGNVRKSKGVDHFLDFLSKNNLLDEFKIKIVGKFESDSYYQDVIKKYTCSNISIDNKFITNIELDDLHRECRYVFFPYTGTSVLNSGALITSFPKAAPIIGPNVGGFKELGELKLINIYNDFTDVVNILRQNKKFEIDNSAVREMVNRYTWAGLSKFLKDSL